MPALPVLCILMQERGTFVHVLCQSAEFPVHTHAGACGTLCTCPMPERGIPCAYPCRSVWNALYMSYAGARASCPLLRLRSRREFQGLQTPNQLFTAAWFSVVHLAEYTGSEAQGEQMFSPFEKTIQLKTKLKAADCAAHLNQVTSKTNSDTKPLTGWIGTKTFEVEPSDSGMFNIQTVGNIKEESDGSTVHLRMQMSRSSKLLFTVTATLILGAFASTVVSYPQARDVFGFSWTFLLLVAIPGSIWLVAFFLIRNAIKDKQDPFVNALCSSLQAQKVAATTETMPAVIIERPTERAINSRRIISATWLALHVVPLITGFGIANFVNDYLHNRAWSAWLNGQYAESESYCRPIMQLTELFYAGDEGKQAYAYYILAENLRCQDKLDEALQYYSKAKLIQEKMFDRNNPTLAWTYDNIGKIYDIQNNPQAVEYYNKAIDIWKKSNPPEETLIARTLNRLALYHAKQNDPAQLELAEEEQLDALSRDRETITVRNEKTSMTIAEDLNDLAVIYLAENKLKDAERTIKEAISIKEKYDRSPENTIRLANSYANYYFAQSRSGGVTANKVDGLMTAQNLYNSAGVSAEPGTIFSSIKKRLRPHIEFPHKDRRSDIRFDEILELRNAGSDK